MNAVHGNVRNIDEIHMPVEAAIETEVAEVRRYPVQIRRVVTEYRYLNFLAGLTAGVLNCASNVERELVVSSDVTANADRSNPHRGGLASALKMEQGSSLREGVLDWDLDAVPPGATIIRLVRIACVHGVEAMG